MALEALALPAAEAPDVTRDQARVDLAAGQVHVRRGDQAALVALERHPLGEHVVGVRQPRGPVRLGLVGELDAVFVQQPAGLRQVGDDRLVGIDQVRVRHPAQVLVGARGRAVDPAPDPDQAQVAVHLPLFLVHARPQQLTCALLGAALAARVVRGDHALGARRLTSAAGLQAAGDVGHHDLPQEGDDDDRRGAECDGHRDATARPARGAREEDHSAGVARDLVERAHQLGLTTACLRLDRNRRPHPLLELAAELLDEPLLVLADLDVTLGDQLLAVARAHSQELHTWHYVTRPSRLEACRAGWASIGRRPRRARPPGPAPAPTASPSRTASDAIARAARAASSGL